MDEAKTEEGKAAAAEPNQAAAEPQASEEAKVIERLVTELTDARKALDQAVEEERTARNRSRDAQGVYNGVCKKIDAAVQRLRSLAPVGTHWKDGVVAAK